MDSFHNGRIAAKIRSLRGGIPSLKVCIMGALYNASIILIFFTSCQESSHHNATDKNIYSKSNTVVQEKISGSKTYKLRYKLQNTSADLIKNLELKAFLPLNTNYQRLKKVSSELAFQEESDLHGNKQAKFLIKDLAPFETSFLELKFIVERGVFSTSIDNLKTKENKSTNSFEVKIPELKNAKEVYRWTKENIKKNQYTLRDESIYKIINKKSGDCTAHMKINSLLLGKIKTKNFYMGGFIVNGSPKLSTKNFHNWIEFKNNNKWHILDSFSGSFKERENDYLAFFRVSPNKQIPTLVKVSDSRVKIAIDTF